MRRLPIIVLFVALLAACGGAPAAATSPEDILSKFTAAGLEAETPTKMQAADYGPAPLLCQEGARRFLTPSLGPDNGGRLFVCSDAADAGKLKAYYDELGKASALFHSWTYQKGGVLVQLNGELEQAKADAYGKVIADLP